MATNDGFSPYGVRLPAEDAVKAIIRAHNLTTELEYYVRYRSSPNAPIYSPGDAASDKTSYSSDDGVKNGDLWFNETNNKTYRAYLIQDPIDPTVANLMWINE